jgi:deazaflavin-dependent oxidoreductase (nitroreductase family)
MADIFAELNREVIEEFRANSGKVGGQFAGAALILLHHRGAKSGRNYVTPLTYSKDGDRIVVIASKAGAPDNPSWYYNLIAHPDISLEIGNEHLKARAVVLTGEERERLFDAQAQQIPMFNEYRKKTLRLIPVIALEFVK